MSKEQANGCRTRSLRLVTFILNLWEYQTGGTFTAQWIVLTPAVKENKDTLLSDIMRGTPWVALRVNLAQASEIRGRSVN